MIDMCEKIIEVLKAWGKEYDDEQNGYGSPAPPADVADRILALLPKAQLFQSGDFALHSGALATWRINAEALDADSINTLAGMIAERAGPFSMVQGVPAGGIPLARALEPYRSNDGPLLIVDDVLTTGSSMEEFKDGSDALGFVVFDRSGGERPAWIRALWVLDPALSATKIYSSPNLRWGISSEAARFPALFIGDLEIGWLWQSNGEWHISVGFGVEPTHIYAKYNTKEEAKMAAESFVRKAIGQL